MPLKLSDAAVSDGDFGVAADIREERELLLLALTETLVTNFPSALKHRLPEVRDLRSIPSSSFNRLTLPFTSTRDCKSFGDNAAARPVATSSSY